MALRTNTIEYAFPTDTTALASGTDRDWSALTLYIPENSSRTFRSVVVEMYARDTQTATTGRVNITNIKLGVKLGSASWDESTPTVTHTDSGEQLAIYNGRDVTSYFATNFGSGTSQTFEVRVAFTESASSTGLINIVMKVVITYEYDDTSQTTRIKTVRIPIESTIQRLSDTLQELGTNQVPNLSTFLPEASKTYRDIFFDLWFHEGVGATTDYTLGLALDSESEAASGNYEQACQSSCANRYVWKRTDMSTSGAHAFKARHSISSGSAVTRLGGWLTVTYEYDHSSSSSIINSLLIPWAIEPGTWTDGTTEADSSVVQVPLLIEEPTTIALAQSGILVTMGEAGTPTCTILAGSQSSTAYSFYGDVNCGDHSIVHRIDSGGTAGAAGFSPARGFNTLTFKVWRTGTPGTGYCGLVILNYTSGKHTSGAGVHNHTTLWAVAPAPTSVNYSGDKSPTAPVIPETSYYASAIGSWFLFHQASSMGMDTRVKRQSGEGIAIGWALFGTSLRKLWDQEWSMKNFFVDDVFTNAWKRYPSDPARDCNLETSRTWRTGHANSVGQYSIMYHFITYHAITFTVSGTVSGSNSGTVNLGLHDSETGELLLETSRTGDGSYSFTWYDDTRDVFVQAYEDATHAGRSADDAAS